jgi:hypothetical protein
MTCKRVTSLTLVLAAALAGCGNYSNEDLEYMNAVPFREDLAVTMPASALSEDDEAELSFFTHDIIKTSSDLLDAFLGIVDVVRAYQPTQRTPNSRTWGPVRAVREIGWQWQFVVTRDPAAPAMFSYSLEMQRIGDPPSAWHALMVGSFEAASGARRGVGAFRVQTSELRMAGYPFENRGEMLSSIDVTYSTRDFPINVGVEIIQFTDTTFNPANTNTLRFEHGSQEDGRGAMRFELTGLDVIPGPPVETVLVTTRWLPSGEGRGEATLTQGDAALVGLQQVQCWDASFRETYNVKPWEPKDNSENTDASVCPDIPKF